MAGSIEVGGQLWTSASWLFRWVVSRIAEKTNLSQDDRGVLHEIVDENLGWFSVDSLVPEALSTVREWIASNLVTDADAELPLDLDVDRAAALDHLQDLARMAAVVRHDRLSD
ncbi:hypothetical protein [Kribbella sp. NPDC000426]|uniref:hypothetical protein n=1 Tax=Kribbella sp. NPDC000426 TaxID=3154255 RepID=UPI003320CF05